MIFPVRRVDKHCMIVDLFQICKYCTCLKICSLSKGFDARDDHILWRRDLDHLHVDHLEKHDKSLQGNPDFLSITCLIYARLTKLDTHLAYLTLLAYLSFGIWLSDDQTMPSHDILQCDCDQIDCSAGRGVWWEDGGHARCHHPRRLWGGQARHSREGTNIIVTIIIIITITITIIIIIIIIITIVRNMVSI